MFNRIALRLAAQEALCPAATVATGPWPTIAGNRVFDSRQDPIDLLDPEEQRPLLILYTEEHQSSAYGRAARFGTDEQIVSLVIEMMIATRGAVPVATATGETVTQGTIDVPVADWQHEILLDVLEGLVCRTLLSWAPANGRSAWHEVAMEVRSVTSVPMRSEDKTVRLAARTLTLQIQVPADDWPLAAGGSVLPAPLSLIAPLFPPGSPAANAIADLENLVAAPVVPGTVPEVALFANIDRTAMPTEPTNDLSGRMQGPSP